MLPFASLIFDDDPRQRKEDVLEAIEGPDVDEAAVLNQGV
jgi:Fe-S-cluster formation regulator IscX/YfhJ